MPNQDNQLFRAPDEKSGPAILEGEPIILPEQRKKLVESVRERLDR